MAAEVLRVAGGKPEITMVSDERNPLSFFSGVGIAALETPSGQVPTAKTAASGCTMPAIPRSACSAPMP